ncbi:hypothetical protein JCM10207_001723 [Rhodosporidiobolus poonsookiae]
MAPADEQSTADAQKLPEQHPAAPAEQQQADPPPTDEEEVVDEHSNNATATAQGEQDEGAAASEHDTAPPDAAESAQPAPVDVDSSSAPPVAASSTASDALPAPADDASAPAETPSAPAADLPSLPLPPPKRRPHPPPPKKGILRPPSSSHAGPSPRFSFRRDVLQSLTAGAPAGAVAGGVQEAVGSAASAAGGFLGSAFKRLSQAAVGAAQEAQQSGAGAGVRALLPQAAQGQALLPGQAQNGAPLPAIAPTAPSAASATAAGAAADPSPSSASSTLVPPSSSSTPPPPPSKPPLPLPISDLKRVRFRVAAMRITYPINRGTLEAIAPAEEALTRERIEQGWRARRGVGTVETSRIRAVEKGKGRDEGVEGGMVREERGEKVWTSEELARLYAECCRTREEPGIDKVRRAFKDSPIVPPKALDLSNTLLSHGAVEALADLLSVDWGCKKLVLDSCGLDDESLKPLLHALLVSACIPTLSLANNKRIKSKGWKLLAVFVRKAKFLRYLDLSENALDRRSAEYLVQALNPLPAPAPPPPPPATALPPTPAKAAPALNGVEEATPEEPKKKEAKKVATAWDDEESDTDDEAEQRAVVAPEAAAAEVEVAGAEPKEEEMVEEVKTEPEPEPEEEEQEEEPVHDPLFEAAPLLKEEYDPEACGAVLSLRLENCNLRGGALEALANGVRTSQLKHISLRRNRINAQGAVQLAVVIRDYPLANEPSFPSSGSPALDSPALFPSSYNGPSPFGFEVTNSVTARQRALPPPPSSLSNGTEPSASSSSDDDDATIVERPTNEHAQAEREAWRLSEARSRLRKQVDELPRVGALLTLDVKGNDLRNGVSYIAQVLKRNRTLKVLNLSENKVDIAGLTTLTEALKYNTTLETLDLSFNPCCGPAIDGILALRSAMMVSSSLKRIFLNATQLNSDGAIALAEFLPESRSLLHLDLTDNAIDISGVLALAVSLKLNSTIRCLDLQIPFDDPEFSTLSQDIMATCVRNTELAQAQAEAKTAAAAAKGAGGAKKVVIAQPIRKSALASNLEAVQMAKERRRQEREEASRAQVDIFAAAAETRDVVGELLAVDQQAAADGKTVKPSEVVRDALVQLQLAEAQLAEAFSGARQGEQRERGEILLTELSSLLDLAKNLYDKPQPPLPSSPTSNGTTPLPIPPPASAEDRAPSPVISVTGSDEDVDDSAPTEVASSPSKPLPAPLDLSSSPPASEPVASPNTARSPLETDSRAMVAEESEIFRKGLALGVGVDDVPSDSDDESSSGGGLVAERDVSGEELKRELLETEVSREVEEEARARRGSRGSFGGAEGERPVMFRSEAERTEGAEDDEAVA